MLWGSHPEKKYVLPMLNFLHCIISLKATESIWVCETLQFWRVVEKVCAFHVTYTR